MKHIGLVVITNVGACICANEIITEADKRGLAVYPEFTMHSFPLHVYSSFALNRDWIGMANKIIESIKKLQSCGVDFVIIPSNTPHYGIEIIKKLTPLPVLNLIELIAEECSRLGYKKVAVLGTKATMQDGLYKPYLTKKGIQGIIPDDVGCDRMNTLIEEEIIPLKQTRHKVAMEIAGDILKKLDCEAFILGCTELPDVFTSQNLGRPVIDSTRILAHRALDYAMK